MQIKYPVAFDLKNQKIVYDLGYPKATEKEIMLHHDDVVKMMAHFLSKEKFRMILKSKYPIIFIDEYQDTSKILADSIVENLVEPEYAILIGFFGDHWQKIYCNYRQRSPSPNPSLLLLFHAQKTRFRRPNA